MRRTRTASLRSVGALALMGTWVTACGGEAVPSPDTAVNAYTEAVKRGDARALRELLTERGRAAYSEKEVEDSLRENQKELLARSATWQRAEFETRATLWSEAGDPVALVLERGQFRLDGVGMMPSRAATPEAALAELRMAVRSRNLTLVLGVLAGEKRTEIESVLEALEAALAEIELAVTTTRGDRAEIELPSGVRISLVRVEGVWRIEEIE